MTARPRATPERERVVRPRLAPRATGDAPKSAHPAGPPGTTFIALLRAVNVAGTGRVTMDALRTALDRRGFTATRTLLQSGNLVFQTESQDAGSLERRLEDELRSTLGLETVAFVRSFGEWSSLVRGNPFPEAAARDPSHLVLALLRGAPPRKAWEELRAAIRGREQVRGHGREAYVVYPDGIGRSPLTIALIERRLGTLSTMRNWNTVRGLEQLATT
jgi:uncharacterized protein (DUF1697 family)